MASDGDEAPLVKLVQVKREIYNPYQPTFRRRDQDDHLGMLHDEQRVTTLPRGIDDYPQGIPYQYLPPCTHVRGYSVLPLYKIECMVSKDSSDLSFLEHCKWADFRRRVPMPDKRITGLASIRENKVLGFCAREVSPEIGESWRNKLPEGHVKMDGNFINELFPEFKKHVCPCTEPQKPVPGTDNLCTKPSEPVPWKDDSPTQPEEGLESQKPMPGIENSCPEPCTESVRAGSQLSPRSQSNFNGSTIPCPRMSQSSRV